MRLRWGWWGALSVAALACAPGRVRWQLLEPPEVANPSYPRGVQLLPNTPKTEWHAVGTFASEDACETARRERTDDAIDRARGAVGDEAKFELPVRRAVNAVCVGDAGR
jgi:hypothetical protein